VIYFLLGTLIVCGIFILIIGVARGDTRNNNILVVGGAATALLAAATLLVVGSVDWRAHQETVSCQRFGQETERVVKFVRYRFADWDCLIQTDEGWINREGLYVDEGPGR
jgi:di/tricarboxylate transporter